MKPTEKNLYLFSGPEQTNYSELISFFNTLDQIVYITHPKTHKILFANKLVKKMFGNVTGQKCYKVFQKLKDPCPFCTNDKIFGKNLGKSYIWEFQNKINQRWYHCIDKAILIQNGQYARCEVAIDITKCKNAYESNELFKAMTDHSPNMVFINHNGKVVYVNKKCTEVMGYSKKEFLSDKFNFMTLVAPEYRDLVRENFKKHLNNIEILPYQYKIITKKGKSIDVLINTKLIEHKDKAAILGTITDISCQLKEKEKHIGSLKNALNQTINALAMITEKKDSYTSAHQQNVANLACAIAIKMGLSEDKIESIRTASLLHDIGKINVPGEILAKPAKLTSLEFDIMKTHVSSGYDILKVIKFPWPISEFVLQHHERINGRGYPHKLRNNRLHIEAKIIAVADVVEAMAHHRPYRPALGIDKALAEIQKNKNILYDPLVAQACLELFNNENFQF
ncbi:MAG: hypothetical protein A2252_08650 [Elusimicrobia bacterium RIFOXYA2_FULL_39_19]|nr:MAG: hypothetical protein A2252_08650 [Elusimicrobia bacterium RIFOXYA2_FULL_39_19]